MIALNGNQTLPARNLQELRICIKGAGDLATGIAIRLYASGFTRIVMLETEVPLAVRRMVSFSEAVYLQEKSVEGVRAKRVDHPGEIEATWQTGKIGVLVDPGWQILKEQHFDVVVDAIIAKRNIGTRLTEATLVIGLGPGFTAGKDAHCVVETHRGHHLGRVFYSGQAKADTGIPGTIAGFNIERLLKATNSGVFATDLDIGDMVTKGQRVGRVDDVAVAVSIDGVVRGLLRNGTPVSRGTKLGDIDPRKKSADCSIVSDKARSLGGSVLEAILATFLAK